jgi:hypothetical protein
MTGIVVEKPTVGAACWRGIRTTVILEGMRMAIRKAHGGKCRRSSIQPAGSDPVRRCGWDANRPQT